MIRKLCSFFVGLLAVFFVGSQSWAVNLLAPGDPIIAIDTDPPGSASSTPGTEGVANAINGTTAKYLNFGENNSGFIVTADAINLAVGASFVQSFLLTTANDTEARDPATYALYGTIEPIVSGNNSLGNGENWTLISSGGLACPAARNTPCPVVSFPNVEPYLSYRMVFPTVKNAAATNSMQLAEIQFFESLDGSGAGVLVPADTIRAIDTDEVPNSNFPGAEGPGNAINGTLAKYLNFGEVNSGFIVTPALGPRSIVSSFTVTTANDAPERDPAAWSLYGTNDPITSTSNSRGSNENWQLIDSGTIVCPADRSSATGTFFCGTEAVEQSVAYSSYRMVFTDVRNAGTANSMQLAEIQFDGTVIPEPGTWALALIGMLAFAGWRFRRQR